MDKPTIIHLVRHGEVHNPERILYGRIPGFRLSLDGRDQAEAAAEYLKSHPLAALFSSPQQRAEETARIIGTACGLKFQTNKFINEIRTPFEGRPLAEAEANNWDLYTGNRPPFELPEDVFDRTQQFMQWARTEYAGQEIAAVTHGDVVTFMLLYAAGKDIKPSEKNILMEIGLDEIYPATASVSSFTYTTSDPDEVPAFKYTRPY